jgi:hypothetical protein
MATITDPDDLSQSTQAATGTPDGNVFINPTTLTIELIASDEATNNSWTGAGAFTRKEGVSLQALYSFLKEEWKTDSNLIKYEFPMEAITSEQFEFRKGWTLNDTNTESRTYIRNGGWAEKNATDDTVAEYMSVITLGTINPNQFAYYAWADDNTVVPFDYDEAVNQAVQIYSDPNGDGDTADGFNKRNTVLNVYIRPDTAGLSGSVVGYTYDSSSTTAIGAPTVTYQAYRFPLSTSVDLNLTLTDAEIAADLITTKGMKIYFDGSDALGTDFSSNQLPITFASEFLFEHVIVGANDAAALTPSEVYNFVQYQLRQTSDIDENPAGSNVRVGKLTEALVQFVGPTLETFAINGGTEGVMIDNFDTAETANLKFRDNTGTLRTFPRIASGNFLFNNNLVNDASAKYWAFFSSNYPGASATLVPDYNDATLSKDIHYTVLDTNSTGATGGAVTSGLSTFTVAASLGADDIYQGDVLYISNGPNTGYYFIDSHTGATITITGQFEVTDTTTDVTWEIREKNVNVDGQAVIPWTFDYDAADRGDASPGTNAPITVVAIGLNNAQYVTAGFTIGDGSGQNFSVVSALERNYSDPV